MKRALAASLVGAQISFLVIAAPVASASLPPSEWVIGPQQRVALITLEGRPTVRQLTRLLDVLARKRARASFFLPGSWVKYHPKKARLITRANHGLGNRGFGKTLFTRMSETDLRSSIARSETVLRRVNAYPKPFLRAPKGVRDSRVLRIAGSMGYRSVRWTFRPKGAPPRKVARRAVRTAQAGSIISLDIWKANHRDALPRIIDGLRRRGFELRTIEALTRAHPVRWDVTLRAGASGPEVTYLAKRLRFTSYPAGKADGYFGYQELQAVYAFEKTHRMVRDGVVTPADMTRIAMSRKPRAPRRQPRNFVDVDISRQVLFEVRDRKVKHTIPISSGNEELYTVDGQTYRAHTPRGSFSIVRKIAGKRVSRLGTLWWPSYFVGGYAIHGSDSVPTYPASHGCVRIPRYVERAFFYRNPIGLPVFVHN